MTDLFFVQEFKCDFCNWNKDTALLPNGEAICIPCYDIAIGD